MRGRPGLGHLSEPLHVIIEVESPANVVDAQLKQAQEIIEELLIPVVYVNNLYTSVFATLLDISDFRFLTTKYCDNLFFSSSSFLTIARASRRIYTKGNSYENSLC